MATRRTQPEPPVNWVFALLEKHGIATVLLVVGGWYVTTTVVEPMVATAQTFVSDIRKVNEEMEKAFLLGQQQQLERWKEVHDLMIIKRELLAKALDEIQRLDDSNREVVAELGKLRAFFTKPFGPQEMPFNQTFPSGTDKK